MKKENSKMFKPFAILSGLFVLISCILIGVSVFADEELPPQVYINNTPKPVHAIKGQPIKIPVLIVGGYAQHQQSELYIWREQDGGTYCFDGNEWALVSGGSKDCKPLAVFSTLPHHVYWDWGGLSSAKDLENCTLHICFDDTIDGVLTEGSLHCGTAKIEVSNSSNGPSSDPSQPASGGNSSSSSDSGPSQPASGGPPSFVSSPGTADNNNQCNSLSYTKANETFSRSVIRETLEVGATKDLNISVNACGKNVSVTKFSGPETWEPWMKVSKNDSGGILLHLDANGLQAGQQYTSNDVTVTAGDVRNAPLKVILTVQGECDSSKVVVSPSELRFSVVKGYDSESKFVYVKNGCGDPIEIYALAAQQNWLSVTKQNGGLSVKTLSSELAVGSYDGNITFEDPSGEEHTVRVYLTVSNVSSSPNGDVVNIVPDGEPHWFGLAAHHALYFSFTAGVPETSDCSEAITVSNTPTDGIGTNVHVLVKRGSLPTPDDFKSTYGLRPKQWYYRGCSKCSEGKWIPEDSFSQFPDLFWNYTNDSSEERIAIRQPMEPQVFYIMLYNNSDQDAPSGTQELRVNDTSYNTQH